ncbi:hypothetical protein SAMN05421820_101116 [Pedobacter steynii]|uniref:Uncharacterized protein n=1 Tax=Pedobacter steynii TaxID=430522 RepID=A0A1G9J0X5_9SPHI|nr:hypothetical protein [Pedobacter steynii]NQX38109.1 hypothetical protein [Pedobacter steynii]SDL31157.1 hypothetical protein SAMN05421820_101116 [Pedobacter steynii]
MIKRTLVILTLVNLFVACGQEKKQSTNTKIMNTQYPEINANNFEQKIFESVKHYPKEPLYYMRINKSNCVLEVLINDYPVHDDYELSNYATPLEINDAILKSGVQKLTYRLYPVGNLIKEEYGEGDIVTTLTDNTAISISIIRMDNKGEKTTEHEEVVMKHTSLVDDKGRFVAAGKPYYEFTFDFNAEVPYTNEGWSKGQDLTKLDQKVLEQKTIEFYKAYAKIYENRGTDLQAKLKFGEERRNAVAFYKKQSDIDDLWKVYLNRFDYKNKKIQPIENYKMVFFGEGKIVFLLSNSLEYPNRGAGALRVNYIDKDGDEAFFIPNVSLYLPEGRNIEDGLYMAN